MIHITDDGTVYDLKEFIVKDIPTEVSRKFNIEYDGIRMTRVVGISVVERVDDKEVEHDEATKKIIEDIEKHGIHKSTDQD